MACTRPELIDVARTNPAGAADLIIALCREVEQLRNGPTPEPTPPRPAILHGASVGTDGWAAVDRYTSKVGDPDAVRTYAAGGVGKMMTDGARRLPGVPQVYGPKTLTTDKRQINTWVTEWLRLDPRLILTPWPENDRHAIKKSSGFTSTAAWVAMMRAFHEVLRDDHGRLDVLWANPTGWAIEDRWDEHVAPVLDYVAGVAVDGYLYQREWITPKAQAEAEFWVWESTQDPTAHQLLTADPTEDFTQASLADAVWCAKRCAELGLAFGGFEQGVQAGPHQAPILGRMYDAFETIHRSIVPVSRVIYWETYMTGLDCRLDDAASAEYRRRRQAA